MEEIVNEENNFDHTLERDVADGSVDFVCKEDVV